MEHLEIINVSLNRYTRILRHFVSTGQGEQGFAVNRIAYDLWEALVAHYNGEYKAKGRKPVEAVLAEAERRGFLAELIPEEDTIILQKDDIRFSYQKRGGGRYLFCTTFSCIPPTTPSTSSMAMARISFCRVSLGAGPLFDCMEELLSAIPQIRNDVNRRMLDLKRADMIAAISLPSLSSMAEKELGPKGIKYYVGRDASGDFIQVNIMKDLWFGGPVTFENIGRILSLIPYGIRRPDCIKKDIDPSFCAGSDWAGQHEEAWKRYREKLDRRTDFSEE